MERPAPRSDRTLLGHPVGLFLLFLVEMWERFSYYGMRGLLVLYLVCPTTGMTEPPPGRPDGYNPGRGWSASDASTLYGLYTGLAYLFPVFGGMIADKLIGTHRSMVVGGILIAAGHIALGASGLGELDRSATGMSVFIFGMAIIVFGTGHFKPSVSVMVGQLYQPGDPRRDGAFSIFYMGINLGAFLCNIVCGILAYRYGWHWGFGAAAVGMIAGLLLYLWGRPRYLGSIGEAPAGAWRNWSGMFLVAGVLLAGLAGVLFHAGVFGTIRRMIGDFTSSQPTVASAIAVGLFVATVVAAAWFSRSMPRGDRGPVATIFIFMFFNAFFWLAFEQAGSSINLFTEQYTQRQLDIFGWKPTIDTPLFQSVNAFFVITLAPIFGMIWVGLGRRGLNPSQPIKIALGLIFLGAGFAFMVWGAVIAKAGVPGAETVVKASMLFILLTYFLHTVGELCLSPTGLSYVTKAAPVRFVSLLMGIWFVSSFIANLGGGLIAAQVERVEKGEIRLPWNFGGQADFFMLFVVSSIGAGVLILILTPLLKKLMRPNVD
ncbi:MAG: peptide MFS transporter [Phycisphaeraceae bacterium]|nr:peptide MFS transporter [Phycisphaeraceae bacterium]